MSRRALAFSVVFLVCAAAAAGAASCSTETVASTAVCDIGTPTLGIVSPVEGACLAVSGGADAYIPVVVNAANFQIRPPGSCSGCANCGHLRLRVNDEDNNASSSSVVDVDFQGKIPGHFGDFKLTVELMDDCGNPWAPPAVDGGVLDCDAGPAKNVTPLVASVTVTTKPTCSATTSSSSGSASSSTGASSSSGGTGGAGGGTSSSSGGTGGSASSSGAGGTDGGAGDGG
jgi:uncharacterized membrane protein YgcG